MGCGWNATNVTNTKCYLYSIKTVFSTSELLFLQHNTWSSVSSSLFIWVDMFPCFNFFKICDLGLLLTYILCFCGSSSDFGFGKRNEIWFYLFLCITQNCVFYNITAADIQLSFPCHCYNVIAFSMNLTWAFVLSDEWRYNLRICFPLEHSALRKLLCYWPFSYGFILQKTFQNWIGCEPLWKVKWTLLEVTAIDIELVEPILEIMWVIAY